MEDDFDFLPAAKGQIKSPPWAESPAGREERYGNVGAFGVVSVMLRSICWISLASFLRLAAAPIGDVPVRILIHTKGCGASHQDLPIYLSFWPANHYPGVGDDAGERKTSNGQVDYALPPGFYRVMLYGRECWEQAQWFSLLAGKPRTVTLTFESFHVKSDPHVYVDYFIYYAPRGSISGLIPSGTTKVGMIPIGGDKKEKTSGATLQDGAYYNDGLSPGHYLVRATIRGSVSEKRALVVKDHLTQVDFVGAETP
jgi:hypothetical protein